VNPDDVIVLAGRLATDGEPYVLATVVRVRRPASTRPGDRALVRAEGTIAGWVGGACSEPVVIRESLRALAAGEPRLVRIGPEGDDDPGGADVVVATACASEGTVEVLLEPCVAGPLLAVVGESPAARTLSQLAPAVGWRVTREVAGSPDAVVVAAMGHGDEDTLQAALGSGAGYVGLVASTRRAASVFAILRDRGVDDAALARVRSPAGLDLGPLRQEEIAVAVLAELVAWRHSAAADAWSADAVAVSEAVDPVCGMRVLTEPVGEMTVVDGVSYHFCCSGCRARFEADPARYIGGVKAQ
jgi:xanthine dehydrogenase accessory factor